MHVLREDTWCWGHKLITNSSTPLSDKVSPLPLPNAGDAHAMQVATGAADGSLPPEVPAGERAPKSQAAPVAGSSFCWQPPPMWSGAQQGEGMPVNGKRSKVLVSLCK